jgi:ubiquitin thioesterase OTU1
MAEYRLRVRHSGGRATLEGGLTASSTLAELASAVADLLHWPTVKLSGGFPPRPLPIDEQPELSLESAGLRSNDTLVAEGGATQVMTSQTNVGVGVDVGVGAAHSGGNEGRATQSHYAAGDGHATSKADVGMQRMIVPADNSCLFRSLAYFSGIQGDYPVASEVPLEAADMLRQLVGASILSQPEEYTEAVLGKPPQEYVTWLARRESWGGKLMRKKDVVVTCLWSSSGNSRCLRRRGMGSAAYHYLYLTSRSNTSRPTSPSTLCFHT